MDAKTDRDVWTAYFEEKKREYLAAGLTPEQADEKASDDIRREIKQTR